MPKQIPLFRLGPAWRKKLEIRPMNEDSSQRLLIIPVPRFLGQALWRFVAFSFPVTQPCHSYDAMDDAAIDRAMMLFCAQAG
jgi:hypothetical protein